MHRFRDGRWGLKLDERVSYEVHPDNPDWTLFTLEAVAQLPQLPGGMTAAAEQMFSQLYMEGIVVGRQIDQNLIDQLVESGRELHPWRQTV